MFSSKAQLKKHTPEDGTDRENYLSLLVDEFINSSSFEAKSQVLANLANFAYDPVNYGYIRDVGVLDIFLYVLKKETNHQFLHFACAGISNLCVDPLNIEYLLSNGAVPLLTPLLKSNNNEIISDVITILINLHNCINLNTPEVIQLMQMLKQSSNKMIVNLATIFLNELTTTN